MKIINLVYTKKQIKRNMKGGGDKERRGTLSGGRKKEKRKEKIIERFVQFSGTKSHACYLHRGMNIFFFF